MATGIEFIAQAYKENTSVRSSIEGERNIQGFFTAYLSVNAYYLTMPEVVRRASSFFGNIQIVWELFLSVLFIGNWLPVIFVWLRVDKYLEGE